MPPSERELCHQLATNPAEIFAALLPFHPKGCESQGAVGHLGGAMKFEDIELKDFELRDTLGTGSFGRVRLVKYIPQKDGNNNYALKILKKSVCL